MPSWWVTGWIRAKNQINSGHGSVRLNVIIWQPCGVLLLGNFISLLGVGGGHGVIITLPNNSFPIILFLWKSSFDEERVWLKHRVKDIDGSDLVACHYTMDSATKDRSYWLSQPINSSRYTLLRWFNYHSNILNGRKSHQYNLILHWWDSKTRKKKSSEFFFVLIHLVTPKAPI